MDPVVPVYAPHAREMDDAVVVHLIHVRKTGGTALKHAFDAHPRTDRYRILHHGHGTLLRDVPPGDKAIFFLRDPVARFVSGFYCRQRMGRPRYNSPWTVNERAAFERFQAPNQLASALSSADESERSCAQSAMRAIQHLCSVFTWLESEAYLLSRLPDIFYIGFQETLDEDFEGLKLKLGLPPELRLSDDEVLSHRRPAHLDGHLDELAVANLRAWYEADRKIIDLCRWLSPEINGRSEVARAQGSRRLEAGDSGQAGKQGRAALGQQMTQDRQDRYPVQHRRPVQLPGGWCCTGYRS